jgi:hypothetical protein
LVDRARGLPLRPFQRREFFQHGEQIMPTCEYKRSKGQGLVYQIEYDQGEYFIQRDGKMKKEVPDAVVAGVTSHEAKPELMLRMAIADIESLIGMDE